MEKVRTARIHFNVQNKFNILNDLKEKALGDILADKEGPIDARAIRYREISSVEISSVINSAIGYLTIYAPDRWSIVDIYTDGITDFTACYRATGEGPAEFVMGAVFNKIQFKYTFHS